MLRNATTPRLARRNLFSSDTPVTPGRSGLNLDLIKKKYLDSEENQVDSLLHEVNDSIMDRMRTNLLMLEDNEWIFNTAPDGRPPFSSI